MRAGSVLPRSASMTRDWMMACLRSLLALPSRRAISQNFLHRPALSDVAQLVKSSGTCDPSIPVNVLRL